jgi:selenocysteine lyase
VAAAIAADPAEVVFTSGGTESNAWAISEALHRYHAAEPRPGALPHAVTSSIEHDSIDKALARLEREGKLTVTRLPWHADGLGISVAEALAALTPQTCLVTLMLANNETGALLPVAQVVAAVQQYAADHQQCILTHTDAAQVLGKLPVEVGALGVDMLTIVGHKFYAPRIGALYVRGLGSSATLSPLFEGGGQVSMRRRLFLQRPATGPWLGTGSPCG